MSPITCYHAKETGQKPSIIGRLHCCNYEQNHCSQICMWALCTQRFPNLCFSNRLFTVKCVYCSIVKMLSDGGDEDVQPQRALFIASR